MNNWERNGYKTKEDASLTMLALIMKNVDGAIVTWNDKVWTKANFSKAFLNAIDEKIKSSIPKKEKHETHSKHRR